MRLRSGISFSLVTAGIVVSVLLLWRGLWLYLFVRNPQYEIKTLTIETGVAKTATEICELTGLREGVNLFSFSAAKLREQILFDTLNISEAEISKKLPDSVRIVVRDRVPVLRLGPTSTVLDRDGLVFTMLSQDADRYRTIPIVEDGSTRIEFRTGRRLRGVAGTPTSQEGRIMRVLELLNIIEKAPEIKLSVLYIDISDDIYLCMQDASNYEIKLIWEEIADEASLTKALQMVSDVLRGPYVRGRRSILVQLEPEPHVTCGAGF